jgi:DNA polymerase III subunit gamma/tau
MEQVKLNLSRKWRSLNFQGIVGQELTLKMLKNSLYIGHYFPVYLFAGQRGCGKTTTARVFASALNCAQLTEFQKKPLAVAVPCGTCDSCSAMASQRHPDFIEIDAASHTGVDTIRNIIEAATLLPIMGRKKIYLIDEAHMLSKSAFNALLKILEEPPKSTLFILATTDQDKIIDTVRSRCFKLFFNAIVHDTLTDLLKTVCDAEAIAYEPSGLTYIAAHAQGSARDALNILEQVRFATGGIQKASVLQVLGHIDDICVLTLLQKTYQGNASELLSAWHEYGIERVAADFLWRRLLVVCRTLLWNHYGVASPDMNHMVSAVSQEAKDISVPFLQLMMEELYRAEQWFVRTTVPQGLLEMVLLRVCSKRRGNNNGGNVGGAAPVQAIPAQACSPDSAIITPVSDDDTVDKDDNNNDEEAQKSTEVISSWPAVLAKLTESKDPHIYSVLSQGSVAEYNEQTQTLSVSFPAHLTFFSDILAETQAVWYPAVRAIFGEKVMVQTRFDAGALEQGAEVRKKVVHIGGATVQPAQPVYNKKVSEAVQPKNNYAQAPARVREQSIDVTDRAKWPKINLVLEYFPGTVTIAKEVQQ